MAPGSPTSSNASAGDFESSATVINGNGTPHPSLSSIKSKGNKHFRPDLLACCGSVNMGRNGIHKELETRSTTPLPFSLGKYCHFIHILHFSFVLTVKR